VQCFSKDVNGVSRKNIEEHRYRSF